MLAQFNQSLLQPNGQGNLHIGKLSTYYFLNHLAYEGDYRIIHEAINISHPDLTCSRERVRHTLENRQTGKMYTLIRRKLHARILANLDIPQHAFFITPDVCAQCNQLWQVNWTPWGIATVIAEAQNL